MALIIGESNPPAAAEIVTQTRCGNHIPNCQASLVTVADQAEARERRARWQHLDVRGDDVVPHYNCHGLTFASRRTAVAETGHVRNIISDDRYEKVDPKEVLPGDVVLYISPEDGDIEHSGIVVALGEAALLNIPRVVSKWGKGFEAVHAANYCPYNFGNAEYYRIRR